MQIIRKIKNILNVSVFFDKIQKDTIVNTNILKNEIIQNRLTLGKLLEIENRRNTTEIVENIHLAEFKIFSQWGDDGIINFLVNYLDIKSKTFIEFGVENYTECNTRFLLINNNWKGLIIDGSESNMKSIINEDLYWRYNLKAITSFVTAENINSILKENEFVGDLGLLHIDIDGNDYWVWKAIDVINPTIVIVEYNSLFGPNNPYTVPYNASFYRGNEHYSNLYYGSSLQSLCDLAQEKGYSFIGCNSNGNNAYFVKNENLKDLKVLSPEKGYVKSMFAESRDEQGKLTFVRDEERLNVIKGKNIYNTRLNQIEIL